MNIAKTIGCKDFPCVDVDHECYMLPDIDIDPERIFIIMIAECAPEVPNDYFYAGNSPSRSDPPLLMPATPPFPACRTPHPDSARGVWPFSEDLFWGPSL